MVLLGQFSFNSASIQLQANDGAEFSRVDHASLFLYIISLRTETGFHENAVERVALDVERHCKPTKLRVTGRFLRRGGVDINPVRSIRFGAATGLAQAFAPGQ